MTDPIADMFSRIKNALNIKAETVDIPHSKIKEAIAKIFLSEGYIAESTICSRMSRKYLRLRLKYDKKRISVINEIKRVSRCGRRIYSGAFRLPKIQSGFGTVVISSSKGLMTGQAAAKQKVGGEVLAYIW